MRVLITGGSSIIGLEITRNIASKGNSSVIFDCLEPSEIVPNTSYFSGDIRDMDALRKAASNCDYGIHLAVVSDPEDSHKSLSINVIGAYNFLKVAEEVGFKNSIIVGSAPVHLPHIETDSWPLFPTASDGDRLYDLTKILQEVVAKDFHDHGLPVICLRFGHVVRGRETTNLKRTVALEQIDYCRGGWVALEDVAAACFRALKATASESFSILNLIGSSPGYERYNVQDTEAQLDFNLKYRFKSY